MRVTVIPFCDHLAQKVERDPTVPVLLRDFHPLHWFSEPPIRQPGSGVDAVLQLRPLRLAAEDAKREVNELLPIVRLIPDRPYQALWAAARVATIEGFVEIQAGTSPNPGATEAATALRQLEVYLKGIISRAAYPRSCC